MKIATNIEHAAEVESIEATTAHTEIDPAAKTGVAAQLGLNVNLFVMQLINFLIVACVLWFLILKPLVKKMEDRRKIIEDSLANADKVKQSLEQSQQKYEETLTRADKKANEILEQAQKRALDKGEDIIEATKAQVADIVERGKLAINQERKNMHKDLREDVINMVISTTEKVLGKKIDNIQDKEWLDKQVINE